jgi:hypothetical protein
MPEIVEKGEEVDEEKIMNYYIEKLHSYHFFTLQSRNKRLMFAHSIETNARSPAELR